MKRRIFPGSRGQAAGRREPRRPAACPWDPGIRNYKQKTAASFPLGIELESSQITPPSPKLEV